ncbi:MAG: Dinitrogenase iron-molybdenum cofactor biosynthesis protein [Paenibacillaceae bacterium]|jgi:predicted Fe-Mo cluster-binding NifX family protein|nr:Dinitrogenase iron-molybdenum cofactor biosynthesis protein [Paenibacillaceae bacterium]
MAFKVAVSSLDGVRINQHFGRSDSFLIYQIEDNGEYALVEERLVSRACGFGGHEEDALERAACLLSDCSVALVSRIGPGAEKALAAKGVKAFEIYDTIERALTKLNRYLQAVKDKNEAKSH